MDNVTRTPAVGVPWGPSRPYAPYRSLIAHARVLVTLSMLIPTQPYAVLGSNLTLTLTQRLASEACVSTLGLVGALITCTKHTPLLEALIECKHVKK